MITTMHSDQNVSPPRVEVSTSVQRRRRWPTAEKIRLVEETMQPGMSVSYVARRAGVAPSLLFNWRRRMLEGGLQAVQADEDVVGTSRVRELERRVRELERLLGRKTMEVEINEDQYVLDGKKRYITNAPIADLFTVFAAHPGARSDRPQISAFIVEKNTPGLRIGKVFRMAGGAGSLHSEVIFDQCRVPIDNRLGNEGDGFVIAMECLDAGRINWSAYCVGAAQNLIDLTTRHILLGASSGVRSQTIRESNGCLQTWRPTSTRHASPATTLPRVTIESQIGGRRRRRLQS